MRKALSFIRLDLQTVKPYFTLKNLALFGIAGLIMAATTDTGVTAIAMMMVVGTLYISYPFAICEKNSVDALYITLSIERRTVVLGRYLFAVLIHIATGALSYLLSFAILTLLGKSFDARETLLITAAMFFVYSILQAFQLPMYFKLGYARARGVAYLPLVGWAIVVWGFSSLMQDGPAPDGLLRLLAWLAARPAVTGLLGVLVWAGVMGLSFRVALGYYRRRDF